MSSSRGGALVLATDLPGDLAGRPPTCLDVRPLVDCDASPAAMALAAERRASIRLVTVEIKLDGPEIDPVTGQAVQVTLRGSFYTPNLAVDEQVDEPA